MRSKDLDKNIMQNLANALGGGNVEEVGQALESMYNDIAQRIEAEFEQFGNTSDMRILEQRGLRQLTSAETAWMQKFIEAVRSDSPRQAITNLTDAMPVTIIDRVLEDMKREHPLLSEITFVDAAGAMKLVMNAAQLSAKLGGWGVITAAITQEVTGAIKTIDVTSAKYTAYFVIPKDFVKFNFGFAPMWVENYIRTILAESIANGLEKSILSGDGLNQFIGMDRNTTTATGGAYSQKTAVAITDFEDSYANAIAANLLTDGNGDIRSIPELLMVVNPIDNVKTVRRIQSTITHAGIIDMISHTFPTKVVESVHVAQGKAVLGIAKNYFAALNGGTSGIVEYDDSAQFLADNRLYTTRIYGNGTPVDNTSFILLDISSVSAPALPVKVKGTVKTEQ